MYLEGQMACNQLHRQKNPNIIQHGRRHILC